MRYVEYRCCLAVLAFSVSVSIRAVAFSADPPLPPSVEFGELYHVVEMAGLFSDQKTFADAIPDGPPPQIMADYRKQKQLPGFDLKAFVALHFATPKEHFEVYKRRPNRSVGDYIHDMWEVLRREADEVEPYSSLLPLGRPYIVPGGRFREIYYSDSYFTMLGLEQDGQHDLARDMLSNIASLIDRYGHVPNGNRSYYLSRSQPPFFSCMVELIAARDGDKVFVEYLPELQAEYDYWMEGAEKLTPGSAHGHVVRLADGALLGRYWDDRAVPRDEILSRGRRDRASCVQTFCGSLRRFARWRRVRMGLQFPLARRRQGSVDDPHHRDRPGRPQYADNASRRDARAGISVESRSGTGSAISPARG